MKKEEIEQFLAAGVARNADLYRRVGTLCTFFAGLETQLRDCISQIEELRNDSAATRLPPNSQFSGTVKVFKRLAHAHLTAPIRDQALDIASRLEAVGKKRNDIVHSSWNATAQGGFHQNRVRPPHPLPRTDNIVDAPEQVDAVTKEAAEIIFDLECMLIHQRKTDAESDLGCSCR